MSDPDTYLMQLMGQAQTMLMGSSTIELRVQFFDVLREFFDNANLWHEAIGFTVVPTSQDYKLEPISGRITRLSNVLDQNNVPQAAAMPIPGWVHFLYPYSNPQPVTAVVIKNVDGPLECFPPDFPDWVLPKYGVGMLEGLVGRMMSIPDTSYTDKQGAIYRLQRFRNEMMGARTAAIRANTIGSQAWAYPQTYRTFSQRGGVSTFNVNPTPTPLR